MLTDDAPRRGRDQGSIMVLTLVLCVVLAIVVMGLASYTTTGLSKSDVTTRRNEAAAAATAAVQYEIEELAHKRHEPCSAEEGRELPVGLTAIGVSVSLTCLSAAEHDGHPAVVLRAESSAGGAMTTVSALVQVPEWEYTARVIRWSAE